MPWRLLMLASPFVTFPREMRSLWHTPVRVDNAKLRAALGEEPHTPLDDAVRATLLGLNCLSPDPRTPHWQHDQPNRAAS